jgi:hypothetical protein
MRKQFFFCGFLLLTQLALCGFSIESYAQDPKSQEVKAAKEESKAAKLKPNLLKVSKNKGVVKETPVNGLEVVEDFVIIDGAIAIEAIATNGNGQGLLKALERKGLRKGQSHKGMIFGYMPIDRLGELAKLPELVYARPFEKPITNSGSVTSQGDRAFRADIARINYEVTGAGSKIGVLSDSYNFKGGEAAGIASGDLPAAGVQVLEDYFENNPSDEGRAMAEIIHDVAPGAAMAFHTAFTGQVGFANGIRSLAAAGCNIIVDDVFYFAEPFFQDGIIAQAVDEVVNNNQVTYFSSAGNHTRSSYQAGFVNSGQVIPGYGVAHDFGGGDIRQTITIPPGATLRLALQWDQPFRSVSGVGPVTDLDLLIYFNNALFTASAADNIANGDPYEFRGITNNGSSPANIEIVITKFAGPDPVNIKWVNYKNSSQVFAVEYDTQSSTSVGHANAAGAIGVGAAPYFNTPAFNPALPTALIESFSSAGGTPILLDINGNRLPGAGITRQKPEITGPDGGNNTFFGFDFEPDGFPNFFGTSASAPHSAAVAALMKERSGNSITRNGILSIMQQTALDMDDPSTAGFDAGFDFGTGYGFIQADAAVLASSITDLDITPTPAEVCEGESSNLVATFKGGLAPFTYTWETTGGDITNTNTATATASDLPPGVQTITVTVKDANNFSISTTTEITVTAASTWYLDVDGDGYYVSTLKSCTDPGEGYKATGNVLGDCDDNDLNVWQTTDLYIDVDGDGYDAGIETVCYGESIPTGYSLTTNGTDCNDNDSNINPGAVEICGNGIDDNCNGQADEGCGTICPIPKGDWKNNPSDWPESALPMALGTTRTYTKAQLLNLLKSPVKGDASIILANQLIAAKLNVAIGASPSQVVLDAISSADAAIGNKSLPAKVKTNNTLGKTMTALGAILDEYNNGLLNQGCSEESANQQAMRMINSRVVADLVQVPWNTPEEEIEKMITGMISKWFGGKEIGLSINTDSYNALQSGLYALQAKLKENEWYAPEEHITVNVQVADKPLATDIQLSNTILHRNIRNGSVIGDLSTIDPVDDQHTYSISAQSDFELVGKSVIWKGTEIPSKAMITVFSTDRAGQTIERVIELSREPRFGDFNMFPNPTDSEVNLEVSLDQTATVIIRIFDAVGRLVYEEEGIQSGSALYRLNIDHLSSGLYTVQVSTGQLVMNKRLIKK